MANPNPFMFGAPPAGGAEPNPFLSGAAPAPMANPFGAAPQANPFGMAAGGMAQPGMYQAQPQYGAFGSPQPPVDASNPFASFGAPAPAMQPQHPGSLFGDTSTHQTQPVPQQPPHQQHYGQFGQYSQVTADNFSQPNVTPSVQPTPPQQVPQDTSKVNPFAASLDSGPPETPLPIISSEKKEVVVETPVETATVPIVDTAVQKEEISVKANSFGAALFGGSDVTSNSQDEMPPPPPVNLLQEENKPEQPAEEVLPPPPVQESLIDDGPLPPPPSTTDVVAETPPKIEPSSELKNIADIHIDSPKMPEIAVDDSLANDSQIANDDQINKGEGSGFGGIFTNDLLDTGETMKAAVSVSDLSPENTDNLDKEDKLIKEEVKLPDPLAAAKDGWDNTPDDVTVKANSIGASLFGGTADPVVVSAEDPEPLVTSEKVNDYNHKPASSSSSSETNTPQKAPMSTGDAIFADMQMNDMPEVSSGGTGAAIFGMSEDSGKDTTGAAIFGVEAPRSIRPQLGQMTGWDDEFDKKFDTAITQEIGDAFDPFGNSGLGGGMGADDFISGNFPTAPSNTPGVARREDAFGQAPMTDDLNNPFLALDSKTPGVDEACDGPLYDDDTTKPLEPFPRLKYDGNGWEMYIRHPPKKKLTAQRYICLIMISL